MSFEKALYIALACGVILLAVGIFLIWQGRERAPSSDVADELVRDESRERRDTHKYFLRMLLGLNSLEDRYIRFTSRALIGFAIVGCVTVIGLGSNAYLLHRLSDVATQNRQGVLSQCHDIEHLKTAIRATINRLAPDPRAVGNAFDAQHCPHITRPPN